MPPASGIPKKNAAHAGAPVVESHPSNATFTLLYDGHCAFCETSSRRLIAPFPPALVRRLSFRDPAVLSQFPQVTAEQCEHAMQLIARGGEKEGEG
ncbi:MAG: hypothetical protein H7Y88_09410, partial [Phycisphaerales bacterium]|nr:hypothetical protein [Phycisphaerales bacterium]